MVGGAGIFSKVVENHRKSQFCYLEKSVLELHRAATIKPRKIERSVFFYWTTTDKLEFLNPSYPPRDN